MSVTWRADRLQVDPAFAQDVDALLAADPGDWYVTCGARDPAVEQAGYDTWKADPENNPKYTDPMDSAHCAQPLALAVDVTLVVNGKDDWTYTDTAWQRMIAAVRASPRLHSGADFPSPDEDHIQRLNWSRFDTRRQAAA